MMEEFVHPQNRSSILETRLDRFALVPAASALCYPFLLKAFHALVGTQAVTPSPVVIASATLILAVAFGVPFLGLALACRPTANLGTRRLAYATESARLLGVLAERLAGRDWVMGADYSIADISLLGCRTPRSVPGHPAADRSTATTCPGNGLNGEKKRGSSEERCVRMRRNRPGIGRHMRAVRPIRCCSGWRMVHRFPIRPVTACAAIFGADVGSHLGNVG
jgi:hypothetical protein